MIASKIHRVRRRLIISVPIITKVPFSRFLDDPGHVRSAVKKIKKKVFKLCLAGSEVNGANSSKAIKKKTYAELIEAEDMLLKERINLNQELVMLGATIMEQRAENENLKRIKLDRSPTLMKNYPCIAGGICGHRVAPSTQATPKVGHVCIPGDVISGGHGLSTTSCKAESDVVRVPNRGSFMLPDLNTLPPEVDSTS